MTRSPYTSRKFLQSSFVIVCAVISLWTKTLDGSLAVTLILGALGVYGTVNYAEKMKAKA